MYRLQIGQLEHRGLGLLNIAHQDVEDEDDQSLLLATVSILHFDVLIIHFYSLLVELVLDEVLYDTSEDLFLLEALLVLHGDAVGLLQQLHCFLFLPRCLKFPA